MVVKEITYMCPYTSPGSYKGTLTLTNYKLHFRFKIFTRVFPQQFLQSVFSSRPSEPRRDTLLNVEVLLGFISRIEKVGGQRSSGENAYGIDIYCKDVRTLRFALNKVDGQPRKSVFDTLHTFSFPLSNDQRFFAYQVNNLMFKS